MPAIPRLTEPLSDGVVALRLAGERDIPEILIAHQDDPLMYSRMGMSRPPSGAELGRHFERVEAEREAGNRADLTIVIPGSDTSVGGIDAHRVDWVNSRAELGLWLAPQVRGRGYAPRALTLASRWLFETCGLERLQLLTEPDNRAMVASAEAAGFHWEGVLRGYAIEHGKRVDLAIMSLLRSDVNA
jgi:RimJ/RimL family protein N-acetyltransferase